MNIMLESIDVSEILRRKQTQLIEDTFASIYETIARSAK